jgi:hypothetical protein
MRKKLYLKSLLFLSTLLLVPSCIVVNFAGRDYDKVCSAHHKKMKRTMVGTSFGLSAYDDNPRLPHCKERQNLGCNVEPWPINRLAIIYHCTACDSAMAYSNKLN